MKWWLCRHAIAQARSGGDWYIGMKDYFDLDDAGPFTFSTMSEAVGAACDSLV